MTDRRALVGGAVSLLTTPFPIAAQQARKVPQIGIVWGTYPDRSQILFEPFHAGLRALATFSIHTVSPPPPSRTPAGSRASSRHTSIAPRTTSAHGPLAWDAPRTRTHRSIPAPPTPAGASRLPRTVPCPTPA